MIKRVLCLIALLTIGSLVVSCEVERSDSEPTKKPNKQYGSMLNADTELEKLTMPFWRLGTMYNECVTMMQRDDGSIDAKMLFKPLKIISVMDVTHKKAYTEGKDYIWDGKSNIIKWIEGSEIKYFTKNDLEGKDENGQYIPAFGSSSNPWDSKGRSRFGNALYCIGEFLYEKQISITYEYQYEDWQDNITEYQGDRIPRLIEKLKNGEDIKLVFYGDSIFTGCDASSMYNREPKLPIFPKLVKLVLSENFNSNIKMYNPSVGGMDSNWGVDNAKSKVGKIKPDLVIIGFGMNDGNKTGEQVASNIKKIIDEVKFDSPDCEFIVVTPMVPNKEAGFLLSHPSFPEEFSELIGDGVAYVDMFSVHSDILKTKDYAATTGNNINHPNDWLIRVYAMNILAVMLEY